MAEISGAWQGCHAVVSQRLKKQLREQERKFAGCLGLQRSCSLLRRGVSKSCVYAGITLLRAVAGGWGVGSGVCGPLTQLSNPACNYWLQLCQMDRGLQMASLKVEVALLGHGNTGRIRQKLNSVVCFLLLLWLSEKTSVRCGCCRRYLAKRKPQKLVERFEVQTTHACFVASCLINMHSLHTLTRNSSICEAFINWHETSTYM